MSMKKKTHSAAFKFKVALAALRGDKTVAALCSEFSVSSSQIYQWRQALLDHGEDVFANKLAKKDKNSSLSSDVEVLHATIGRLKVENDFLETAA
jgi:transposase